MNKTELRFTLSLIPFLDSVESHEDGMVKLRDRRWLVWHPDVMAALFRTDRALGHPPSRTLSPLLGNRSVLWLDGADHTAYRRALTPCLRANRYQDLITELVERATAELPEHVGLAAWTRELTLRIIGRIVFGVDDDELLAAFSRWLDRRLGSRVRTLAHRYFLPGTTRFDPDLDRLLLARASTAEPPALAAYLPPEDLRDQVVSLLFAGHETTASATAWTVYWIDQTPGLADRLRDDDDDDELLDATIMESLRLSPPATLAGNRMSADGMMITPSIYLAHRRAATYEQPHLFDPTRFLDAPPRPGAFFPFGGGVRHCPGRDLALLEIRTIVKTLLRHRHVQCLVPRSRTPQLRGAAMAPPPDLAMVATCRR